MTEKNFFGTTLNSLLSATKKLLPRKTISTILGVSESAISQWTKGKTFPEPTKVKDLIVLYKAQELDSHQNELLSEFMCSLEFPIHEIWHKAPDALKDELLSDYVLKDIESDIHNSISVLYYDLKQELFYQFLKQIEIVKIDLQNKLLTISGENPLIENNSTFEKVTRLKKLKSLFRQRSYSHYLTQYAKTIKEINKYQNYQLKKMLDASKLEVHDFYPNHLLKVDNSVQRTTMRSNNENGLDENKFQSSMSFHFTESLPEKSLWPILTNGCLENKEVNSKIFVSDRSNAMKVMNCFLYDFAKIEINACHFFELTFGDPLDRTKELLVISMTNEINDHISLLEERKIKSHLVFDYFSKPKRKIFEIASCSAPTPGKTKIKDTKWKENPLLRFSLYWDEKINYFGHSSNDLKFYENLKTMLIQTSMDDEFEDSKKSDYLLKPEITNNDYGVRLIKLKKNEQKHENNLGSNLIILLIGDITLSEKREKHNKKYQLSSSILQNNKKACMATITNIKDCCIEGQGDLSLALLVEKYKT